MIGVYEGNDGHRYLKLTVGEDSLDLNGTIGTIVSDFTEYEGTIRGRVAFGDTTYYVDYVDDGTDRYIALTSESTVATLYPEGTVEEPLPPLPTTFVGTWKGTDLETSLAYTLVVDGEGIPTLNGTRGYVQFVSESGAEASILFGEELYELTLSSSGILLEKADHSVSAVLVREEIEEPDEPAVLVPEAAWIGVWKDEAETLTIEITADGYWMVNGEYASNVQKSGQFYSARIGKYSESVSYQMELIEQNGETVMEVKTLSNLDGWILHKEGAEAPALELPAGWTGTWTGTFMQMDITLTIAGDGTITILGSVAEGATYDEATGTLSITFMGMPATATLEWNQGIYEIHVEVKGSELVLRKDGEAPVTLPAGWLGEWSGTIKGMSIALTVADDMTITMGEGVLTGWTYDAAADELHIDYSGMAIVAALVEEDGVSKIAIKMGETILGYLEKAAVETPSIPLPAEWAGTWVGVDTNAEDGATYTVVITEEGTITVNGAEATVTSVDDYGWYDLLLNGKKYTIWKNGEQLQLYSTGTDAIRVNMTKQEVEEPDPEPAVEIPEGMIGTWSATELGKTYELIVTADTITLNGVEGTGLTAFEEDSYGDLVAHIYFDGVEHSIAYSAGSGFTPSVILDNLETSSLYDYPYLKKVEVEEPDPEVVIPEEMIGTWRGEDGYTGTAYELVVTADSIALNGVVGTGLTAFEEDSYGDLVATIYFDGVEHSVAYSATPGFTPSVILDNLETSSLYDYPTLKKVEVEEPDPEPEEPELAIPDGYEGTFEGVTGGVTYTMVISGGTMELNGTVGTLTELTEVSYGWTGKADFGGTVYGIEFSENFDNEPIISINCSDPYLYWTTLDKVADTTEPEPEPEEPSTGDGEVAYAAWFGTYEMTQSGKTYTMIISADGITLNGVAGTAVEEFAANTYGGFLGKYAFDGIEYGIELYHSTSGESSYSIYLTCKDNANYMISALMTKVS